MSRSVNVAVWAFLSLAALYFGWIVIHAISFGMPLYGGIPILFVLFVFFVGSFSQFWRELRR